MYRIEYLQFNGLMQEVMSEELSLDYIVQIKLNGKPSKEEKNNLKVQNNTQSNPL